MEYDAHIQLYFSLGLQYNEIINALALNHRIVVSIRTFKRSLKRLGLFRRKNKSDVQDVAMFIAENIRRGSNYGYRLMHLRCIQQGFVVSRETVRLLIQILDPAGVLLRSHNRLRRRAYFARGPNFIWHFDSYDKLKPFGFCISGCIDGFSRFVIWLNVYKTNSDPRIIGGYYIDAVRSRMGHPRLVRGDCGTENGSVAAFQTFFSDRHSFIYGTSPHNQRIESWWCILRKCFSQYWINFFGQLRDEGAFTGDFLDTNILQHCFMKLIQDGLDEVVREWNCHRIRKSTNQNVPNGRPLTLYTMPELHGHTDQLADVNIRQLQPCLDECIFRDYPCDEDVFHLCIKYMVQNRARPPTNHQQALSLYLRLRTWARHAVNEVDMA